MACHLGERGFWKFVALCTNFIQKAAKGEKARWPGCSPSVAPAVSVDTPKDCASSGS
jgi:hypothetical protein